VKTILERKIADSLKMDYVVNAIAYEYAASRDFIFEVHLGGTLKIQHVLSPSDVSEGVRPAIESFNREVTDFLQEYGWYADPKTTSRRRTDNVYEFDLSKSARFVFSENEVFGDMARMEKDSEASNLDIDWGGDYLEVSAVEYELRCFIMPVRLSANGALNRRCVAMSCSRFCLGSI
jgi:hypothetical protein